MSGLSIASVPFFVVTLIAIIIIANSIRILREYERGVIFRLGRLIGVKGPGLILLWPMIDRMVMIPLRTVVMDVPPQDVITRDNVSVKVNAVLYFRVVDASRAVVSVENYLFATSQLAQTTLRSILGQAELDQLLSEREKINSELQLIIDKHSDPWGIKVTGVELKDVDLPVEMKRAMAKQAEAERERRAKVISADGEFQASVKLSEAAANMEMHPISVQLRFFDSMREIATEKNSTIVLPIPLEFLAAFGKKGKGD